MSLFETTVNQTVRGFAEYQYTELTRRLVHQSEEIRQLKQSIQQLGEHMAGLATKEDLKKAVDDGVAEAVSQASTLLTKEKTEIVNKIDELIAKLPKGGLTVDDLVSLKGDIATGITAGLAAQIDDLSTAEPTGTGEPNPNPGGGGGDGSL